jgi:integrase
LRSKTLSEVSGMARKHRKKTTKKTENGGGSIWQLPNGRFAVAVSVPGSHGKKRLKATAATYALAKVERDRLKDEASRGVLSGATITVEQVIDLYSKSQPFAENTLATHVTAKGNLKPLLAVQMRRLTPLMIAEWLAGSREKIGGRACEIAANILKASCKHAVDLQLVARTPFTLSVPRAEPKEIQPFTDEEVVRIITAAMAHPFGAIIVLAMACGMRQGEAIGLRWGDILWDAKTLRVARQVTECNGKNFERIPKTKRSLRSVPLPTAAIQALKLRFEICEREGRAKPSDWVFATKNGNPMFRTNFYTGVWVKLLEKLKIDHRGLHHGRHTTATILLAKGIPVEAVSSMLGHSRPSMTYDKYSHYRDGSGRDAANAMDSVIGCPTVAPQPPLKVHRAS